MTGSTNNRFVNSATARLLALVLAVAIALLAFLLYHDDVGRPLLERPKSAQYVSPR